MDDEDDFLIEKCNLSYYFSVLSYLDHIAEQSDNNGCRTIRYLQNDDSNLAYADNDLEKLPYFDILRMTNLSDVDMTGSHQEGIFHFATHAFTNDTLSKFSYINLDDQKVYVNDLFTMNLNNDLTFLGAWSTGKNSSSSMINFTLGLGVAAAGSQNHIQTLWNINDKSSSLIINSFYTNLSEGVSYRNALNDAQIEFLTTCPSAWRHPYYWASFQFYGRPEAKISIPWYRKWFS